MLYKLVALQMKQAIQTKHARRGLILQAVAALVQVSGLSALLDCAGEYLARLEGLALYHDY